MNTKRNALVLLGLSVALVLLWDTPVLLPIKLLTVFFHEFAHAAATWLTGGEVQALEIAANQSGHVVSLGGNRFVILSAGYVGSLLVGAGLFLVTGYTRQDRWVARIMAAVLAAVTVAYMRTPFALAFCLIVAAAIGLMSFYLSNRTNDLVLHFIALASMLYVPLDIYSDTLRWGSSGSDAHMLAELVGGTARLWGFFWLALSAIILIGSIVLRGRMKHP